MHSISRRGNAIRILRDTVRTLHMARISIELELSCASYSRRQRNVTLANATKAKHSDERLLCDNTVLTDERCVQGFLVVSSNRKTRA